MVYSTDLCRNCGIMNWFFVDEGKENDIAEEEDEWFEDSEEDDRECIVDEINALVDKKYYFGSFLVFLLFILF